MLKSSNEIRIMNWHVYVCLQNICMILVIRYMYPLPLLKKNEIDKCVGYEKKNNSKTKLRKIGASLRTHSLSNRMQLLAFSPTIISAFCSISWFVNIRKKQSSDLSLKEILEMLLDEKNVQFKESKQGLIFWIAWICSRTVVCPYTSLQLKYWANL